MVCLSYWLVIILATAASGASFSGKWRSRDNQEGLLPSEDPFYAVPYNIHRFLPGQIIDYRAPPSEITSFGWGPTQLKKAYQILYRTTDSLQQPTASVLTVLIPPDADYDKVVSFQMAEDSATINCGPSFTMQRPAQQSPLYSSNITQLQLLFATTALARNWVVIIPDFEGPRAAYASSKITAYSILDGIRAAKHSGYITGIVPNPRIGIWGYSGGAAATQAAISMQGRYAPELEIAGVAMGGLPGLSKVSDIFVYNKSPSAGLIASAMLGLSNQYQVLRKDIDLSLKPQFRDQFYSPLHMCLQEITANLAFQDVLGMFYEASLPGLIRQLETISQAENTHPQTTIKAPLYIYQNIHDRISNIDKIDELVRGYCEQGTVVYYERDDSLKLNHASYAIVALQEVLLWMQDRFDGKSVPKGCVNHTDSTATLDPMLAALFPQQIIDVFNWYLSIT